MEQVATSGESPRKATASIDSVCPAQKVYFLPYSTAVGVPDNLFSRCRQYKTIKINDYNIPWTVLMAQALQLSLLTSACEVDASRVSDDTVA